MPAYVLDPSGDDHNPPTAAAGAGAGTGPPAPVVDPNSSDSHGSVTFGSGTVPGAGAVVTVTFNRPRDASRLYVVLLQEITTAMAGIDLAVTSRTSTGFTISTNTRNLAASQGNTVYGISWNIVDQ